MGLLVPPLFFLLPEQMSLIPICLIREQRPPAVLKSSEEQYIVARVWLWMLLSYVESQ